MLTGFFSMLRDDEGATLVEYTLIVALVAAACVVVITALGNTISSSLQKTVNSYPT